MKKIINNFKLLSMGLLIAVSMLACSNEDFYDKEFYHPVLYLLSSGSQNVYTQVIPFKEANATGYFSVGCGGSTPNAEPVEIEIEADTVLLKSYNRLNFVVDTPSFAKPLAANRYQVGTYKLTFPANSKEQYVKIPIKINQTGLSPDSIYFIPLSIKSVSKYEVNPARKNVLFRVAVENDFAKQIVSTVYYQRGIMISGTTNTPVNGSKIVQPLSTDEIRMFAGTRVQTNKSTLAEINSNSIVVKINSDNSTLVSAYKSQLLQVEQLNLANYNRFYTQKGPDGKDVQYVDISYRFRSPNPSLPGGFGAWTEMRESLQRTN